MILGSTEIGHAPKKDNDVLARGCEERTRRDYLIRLKGTMTDGPPEARSLPLHPLPHVENPLRVETRVRIPLGPLPHPRDIFQMYESVGREIAPRSHVT